jgi:uncharacterized delta-60 repeat protein
VDTVNGAPRRQGIPDVKSTRRLHFVLAMMTCATSSTVLAADGDLVLDFGDDGIAQAGITDAYTGETGGPIVQADGSVVYCSTRATAGPSGRDFVVLRLTPNGQPDNTFNFSGRVDIDFNGDDDECTGIAVQPDGKIVLVGSTVASDNASNFAVARLNADGSLDPDFGSGTGKQVITWDAYDSGGNVARAVALQSDGSIVVAGRILPNFQRDFAVARLLPDGSYDTTFNLTGRQRIAFDLAPDADDEAYSVAIDASGRILLGGYAENLNAAPQNEDFALARLLPNGQLDANFDADGLVTVAFDVGGSGGSNDDRANAITIQNDGKIVLAGTADVSGTSTVNQDFALVRLLPNGAPDNSFGSAGRALASFDRVPSGIDVARAVVQQDNGNLLVAGYAQTVADSTGVDVAMLRLRPDGSRDPGFGNVGKLTIDFGRTNPGQQIATGVALSGSHILVSGGIVPSAGGVDVFAAALQNDTLFANGFE